MIHMINTKLDFKAGDLVMLRHRNDQRGVVAEQFEVYSYNKVVSWIEYKVYWFSGPGEGRFSNVAHTVLQKIA